MTKHQYILANLTQAEAREERLRLEADGQAATSRLRKLYSSLHDELFQTITSGPGWRRLDGLAKSLSRLGMIDELDELHELMKANKSRKQTGVYTKWFVDHIPRSRMEAFVARRDYTQSMLDDLNKSERAVLFRGPIYQGDLDDAHTMLQGAVSSRKSHDAFPDREAVYSAGRLADRCSLARQT